MVKNPKTFKNLKKLCTSYRYLPTMHLQEVQGQDHHGNPSQHMHNLLPSAPGLEASQRRYRHT
jgi:hypothetical protein